MASVAKSLRAKHPREKLYILVAKRNSGSFTYDGIELGGERVCVEIEDELQQIERRGGKIKKLSLVGYSLGGLVARYAIGLLHARGILDTLECKNFTAIASPFLGVRSPLRGWANNTFNVLGARTLCMSGRQLFGIDKFRDTGKPIITVLSDPNSIFMTGLARFQRHTLYANIVNDRSAPYFTTAIAKTDPFTDLTRIKANFVPGYEDVILDPLNPVTHLPPPQDDPEPVSLQKWASNLPFYLALTVFVPVGVVAFLLNSAIQTVRSSRRVKQHESGLAGINPESYRVNLWINEIREAVEDAYENINNAHEPEYLAASSSASDDDDTAAEGDAALAYGGHSDDDDGDHRPASQGILALERKMSRAEEPTLALAPYQFEAIRALDTLKWRKYPVWIHKVSHSHAAILVRKEKDSFSEGYIVLRHWLDEEFLL
ncbi:putative serine esterase-domain-containing protein [Cercophora scortea]|uniref:Serine esterase-domain-containing protein n=1 Tax=Cercophora scortea TaxID=314031 RepID=A0AAE0MCU9_9PEZI|nr:putative serine esterase-domain-containing protein [Cercophora scortea]